MVKQDKKCQKTLKQMKQDEKEENVKDVITQKDVTR